MFSKESKEFIGTCGYHCWSTDDHQETKAEIGFDLAPNFWGKGLMQEALNPLIRMGFDVMGLDYVEATTEPENIQSQRLLKKLGFDQERELKDGLIYFTLRKKKL